MTSPLTPAQPAPDQSPTAFLAVDGISKTFATKKAKFQVFDRLCLTVQESEFLAIIGPSGCGKSTLINLIAGLLTPDQGTIWLAGQPVTKPGADRGVVFQHHLLLPWMTAYENVRFGLDCTMPHASAAERDRIARHYLAMVQLDGAHDKKPSQLSGGMQQRVGIARAFAIRPRVLLLDEPFGAVDAVTRLTLQGQLLRIWELERRTVVLVTHDVDEALLADRIVVMSSGPGAVFRKDLAVPFPRPRARTALLRDPAYHEFRAELLALLTDDPMA
jgi:nitrate ABC transporter ATP-binding subunit